MGRMIFVHESISIAVNEFLHVGIVLVVLIAVVSVVAGLVQEYLPQEELQSKLGGRSKWGPVIGAALGTLTPL
jgi:uncharacterized protein